MIYVIKAPHMLPDDDTIIYKIKIGYSSDEEGNGEKRLKNYKENGLSFKVLFTIPNGDLLLEQRIHSYFKEYRFDRKEWYYFREEIIDFFNEHKTAEEISNALPRSTPKIEVHYQDYLVGEFEKDKVLVNFFDEFFKLSSFRDKLKYYCSHLDVLDLQNHEGRRALVYFLLPILVLNAVDILGKRKCMALRYRSAYIKRELIKVSEFTDSRGELSKKVYSYFNSGNRYPLKEVKTKFTEFFADLDINACAKATDLLKFFEAKECNVFNEVTGKYDKGYELSRSLEEL